MNAITFRQKQTAKLRQQCREMMQAGMAISDIAEQLGVVVSTVHNHTRDLKRTKKTYCGCKPKTYNDWLDPDDEANVHQFWVPSPEEIARVGEELRKLRKQREEETELTIQKMERLGDERRWAKAAVKRNAKSLARRIASSSGQPDSGQ
jgi:predicted transcriptional regulator